MRGRHDVRVNNLGIAFDRAFSQTLLECTDIVRSSSPERYQEALFAVLMHDHVWVPERSILEGTPSASFEAMQREGLISVIPPQFFKQANSRLSKRLLAAADAAFAAENSLFDSSDEADDAISDWGFLQDMVAGELQLNHALVSPLYLSRFKSNPPTLKQLEDMQLTITCGQSALYASGDFLVAVDAVTDERGDIESTVTERFEYDMLRDEDLDQLVRTSGLLHLVGGKRSLQISALEKHFAARASEFVDEEINKLRYFDTHVAATEILDFSAKMGIPAKLSIPLLQPCTIEDGLRGSEIYRVYRVILEEIESFPRLTALDDVFRLRGDSRVTRFREVVSEWGKILRAGEEHYIPMLRNDLRLATKDLRKIDAWRGTSSWATYLAIPFWIADKLSQGFLGNVLSVVSTGYQFKSDRLKKRHEWLLLGQ